MRGEGEYVRRTGRGAEWAGGLGGAWDYGKRIRRFGEEDAWLGGTQRRCWGNQSVSAGWLDGAKRRDVGVDARRKVQCVRGCHGDPPAFFCMPRFLRASSRIEY